MTHDHVDAVRDPRRLIAEMRPLLRPGAYVFTTVDAVPDGVRPIMTFTEDEGLTLVVAQPDADAAGLRYDLPMSWITLRVHSALDGVGLTAAVSTALAEAGIGCNVVAAAYHDHLFVPARDADAAIAVLTGVRSS